MAPDSAPADRDETALYLGIAGSAGVVAVARFLEQVIGQPDVAGKVHTAMLTAIRSAQTTDRLGYERAASALATMFGPEHPPA